MAAFDAHVFLFLHHALAPYLLVAAVLSFIGGGWGALVVLPLYATTRFRAMARALTYVLALDAGMVYGLKSLVARVRPCACLPDVHALVFGTPTDYSFPSGHSAGSFAFAVFFAVLLVRSESPAPRRRIFGAIALVLLAVGVGLSRIALGVHFPGDVLAGGTIGATIGGVGAVLHLRSTRRAAAIPVVPA
jgi:undecaprenyl-diphosphatase